MSVASKNIFALLNADEEATNAPAAVTAQPVVEAPKPNQKKTASTRGGRYYQRGGGKPATTAPPAEDPISPTGDRKYNDRPDRGGRGERGGDRGGDRGYRGRGGGYRGRGRGGDRDARPDRHSATGITDTNKKLHQGWGGDRGDTELKDETNGANDAAANKSSGDAWGASGTGEAWAAPTEGATGDGWDAPATGGEDDLWADKDKAAGDDAKGDDKGRANGKKYEEEEEDNKLTLDEYRAKTSASEVLPKLELRKANEGTSDLFKGAVQLTKDLEGNAYFAGKGPKTSTAPRTKKEAKQYIEIDARFDPPSRGGRGRGRGGRGDGAPRGSYRGDRGGERRSYQQQPRAVDVGDTNAFPAL